MPRRLTHLQARLLLLALGVVLSAGQTFVAWERGAAPVEVLAPALYLPVFAGAIFLGLPGGLAAAGGASLIYGILLGDQLAGLGGVRPLAGLLAARVANYVLFAVILAPGSRYVEERLRKLELYDHIDDLTGLYNSAFFLQDTDLETSRSNRYRTLFSVSVLEVRREAFTGFTRRRYRRVLRELAQAIGNSVRRVDRPARVDDGERDVFLVVLPETGPQGAQAFTQRLDGQARALLAARGCQVDGQIASRALSYPEDAEALAALRDEIGRLEAARRAIRA